MTELKPCPFCRGAVCLEKSIQGVNIDFTPYYGAYILCPKCDIKFDGFDYYKSEDEITEWWNTRAYEKDLIDIGVYAENILHRKDVAMGRKSK